MTVQAGDHSKQEIKGDHLLLYAVCRGFLEGLHTRALAERSGIERPVTWKSRFFASVKSAFRTVGVEVDANSERVQSRLGPLVASVATSTDAMTSNHFSECALKTSIDLRCTRKSCRSHSDVHRTHCSASSGVKCEGTSAAAEVMSSDEHRRPSSVSMEAPRARCAWLDSSYPTLSIQREIGLYLQSLERKVVEAIDGQGDRLLQLASLDKYLPDDARQGPARRSPLPW